MIEARAPRIAIIVAALDEEDTIEACVRRIAAVYADRAEILVVDGGHDRTGDIVRRLEVEIPGVRYVRNDHDRGKGHAIRVGCAHARAPVTAQIDADLQFLPEELPELVAPIERGEADVTLGTRFAPSSTRRPGSAPLFRSLGNRAASAYASLLFGQRMTDVQAGMKAWTTRAMELIAFESDGYSYEVEIPARALLAGLRVVEVPISTDPRAGGTTKVNVLLDGARLAWDMSRFRARAWWTARANRGRM